MLEHVKGLSNVIAIATLSDWLINLAPVFQPMRGKAKTNRSLIGQFEKYHNTFCLSPQILHKHCFQFLLGRTMVRRENKNNAYAKFGGTNKEYYGIFRTGLFGRATFPAL